MSRPRRPRRLKGATSSAAGLESSEHPTAEMSSVQASMELALPRFAMMEGPGPIHPPWSVATDPPASPAPSQIEPHGGEEPSAPAVDLEGGTGKCNPGKVSHLC